MNRHEELQDRYEDALFALLMDKIAMAEGEEALEEIERLKSDPEAAIPEDVDRRCLQTIQRHFAKRKARTVGRLTLKAVKYAVMAAGIAGLMFTAALAASETVRINTLNMMIEVFDTDTTLRFVGETSDVVPQISIGWLPDGYVLEKYEQRPLSIYYEYKNSEDGYIYVDCTLAKSATISVDTENAEVEYIEINGYRAMLIRKGEVLQLLWPAKGNTIVVGIITEGVNEEDFLHIANELAY